MDRASHPAVVDDVEKGWLQRRAVESPVDAEGAADQPRAGAAANSWSRLEGADQHRMRGADGHRDEVQAVVHSVDEIDVGVAGRAEHGPSAGREAPSRMRGE